MSGMRSYPASLELAEAVARMQAAGWTWETIRRAGGPSSSKLTAIAKAEGVVSTDVLLRMEDVFGWAPGAARELVDPSARLRTAALRRLDVVPPRQASSRGRTTRRGKDDTLMPTEREDVIQVLTETGRALLALAERLNSSGPEDSA